MLKSSIAAFDSVNIIVNNAATTHRRQPIRNVVEAEFDRLFAINVKSVFLSTKTFAPYYRRRRRPLGLS